MKTKNNSRQQAILPGGKKTNLADGIDPEPIILLRTGYPAGIEHLAALETRESDR